MNVLTSFKNIRAFILDVEGVLTDGRLLLLDDGQACRMMNIRDSYAMQLALLKGYRIMIISGSESDAVRTRLQHLGIEEIFMQVNNKKKLVADFMQKHSLTTEEVLYMGDDIPDIAPMKTSGLPCCPADAVPEVKAVSQYISPMPGGFGCVRDVIEKVLKLNHQWNIDGEVSTG